MPTDDDGPIFQGYAEVAELWLRHNVGAHAHQGNHLSYDRSMVTIGFLMLLVKEMRLLRAELEEMNPQRALRRRKLQQDADRERARRDNLLRFLHRLSRVMIPGRGAPSPVVDMLRNAVLSDLRRCAYCYWDDRRFFRRLLRDLYHGLRDPDFDLQQLSGVGPATLAKIVKAWEGSTA